MSFQKGTNMDVRLIDIPDSLLDIGDWSSFYAAIAFNQIFYDNKEIFRIDENGLDHRCYATHDVLRTDSKDTIKFEGIERNPLFLHLWFVLKEQYMPGEREASIHLFSAKKDGYSFPDHTDPDDLIIYCVNGTKTMNVAGVDYEIKKGQGLIMPANVVHRATNQYDSIMLSIGFKKT